MGAGLDPEFFIVDSDDYIVPAELFIPHGRETSKEVIFDNAAVEIRPPATTCRARFVGYCRELMWHSMSLYRLARRRGDIPQDTRPSFAPAHRVRPEHLDEYESLQVFGCDPSLVIAPDGAIHDHEVDADPLFDWRSAGFHLHESRNRYRKVRTGTPAFKAQSHTIIDSWKYGIELADIYLGLVDVIMCDRAGWLEESRVRRMNMGYGRAGEFRFRKVGGYVPVFEYRTMSPWPLSAPLWVWWASAVMRTVFGIGSRQRANLMPHLPERSEVVEAIDTCDPDAALDLWLTAAKAWVNHADYSRSPMTHEHFRRLYHAMLNGGHTYYTLHWSVREAWFRNKRDIGDAGDNDTKPARYAWLRDRSTKRYHLNGGHDRGAYRYFPHGTGAILKNEYNSPSLPTLDRRS